MSGQIVVSRQEINTLSELLRLDAMVYPKDQRATFDEVLDRYKINKNLYVVLCLDTEIIGYLCVLPIRCDLYTNIMNGEDLIDSEISGQHIVPYSSGNSHRLYLTSAVIHPSHQGKGLSKFLIKGLYGYLLEKKNANILIASMLATAVSPGGKKLIEKMKFNEVKRIYHGYAMYELLIDDAVYKLIEDNYHQITDPTGKIGIKYSF